MKRLIQILVMFCCCVSTVMATTFKGHVYDKETGEPLVGATVRLADKMTVTGLNGSFELKGLKKGTYMLRVSHVTYKLYERRQEVLKEGTPAVRIYLEPIRESLTEVSIVSKKDGSSDRTATRLIQQSAQMVNVVSGRAIEISPDLTVANVIQRVSGITVERNSNGDAQHAILRGMDKRYNYTLVNGVKIPSPDNQYRYVPLDIFPSDLMERLEVYKSLTPDMEGDAVGGVINMVMKDAPDRLQINANISGGYNQLFLDRKFMSYDHPAVRMKSPYEMYGSGYRAQAADFPAGLLDYKYGNPSPNVIGSLSLGQRFLDSKLGMVIAGSYQNTYRGSNSTFYNSSLSDNQFSVITSQDRRQFSEQQTRYGLHSKVDYVLNPNHKFSFYNVFLDLDNYQVRDVVNTDYSNGYNTPGGSAILNYSTRSRFTRQEIYNGTLHGEHRLLAEKLRVKWSAVYSSARNSIPDNTLAYLYGTQTNWMQSRTYVDNLNKNKRRWERNTDEDKAGYLDFSYSLSLGSAKLDLSAGGLYRDKQRSNFYNSYSLNPLNSAALFGTDFQKYNEIEWVVQNPGGAVNNSLTYGSSEKTSAGYGMFKYVGGNLEAVGGLRVEHTDQGYDLLFQAAEERPGGKQIYTDLLPSLTLKYHIGEKHQLHASYFRSLNRPGFSEIVPAGAVYEEYREIGNPDLRRAIADNFDLRYEFFPGATDHLLLGAFYKNIKDPIEYTLQRNAIRGQDTYFMPGNFGRAHNVGAEIDAVKYFNKFGLRANYTWTRSRITTSKFLTYRDENGNVTPKNVDQRRPLYGQSEHVGNLSLLYKDGKRGWDVQLAGAYTGARIVSVSQYLDNDLWQEGVVQLDFSLEKRLKKGLSLIARAGNLLNTPNKQFIKGTNPQNQKILEKIESDGRTLIRDDRYGQSYLLGLRYKFSK
ncbi:TonB-dependent receptor domain-containing protein [Arcticibacter sp. MXS-1]|uniref:TonB-dependent receptor n=1 Tax=Arcticibacter sp. MXS-1 TaxID=3341726 RepID=UPI0035A98E9B